MCGAVRGRRRTATGSSRHTHPRPRVEGRSGSQEGQPLPGRRLAPPANAVRQRSYARLLASRPRESREAPGRSPLRTRARRAADGARSSRDCPRCVMRRAAERPGRPGRPGRWRGRKFSPAVARSRHPRDGVPPGHGSSLVPRPSSLVPRPSSPRAGAPWLPTSAPPPDGGRGARRAPAPVAPTGLIPPGGRP